jgi:hypothetical protein
MGGTKHVTKRVRRGTCGICGRRGVPITRKELIMPHTDLGGKMCIAVSLFTEDVVQ